MRLQCHTQSECARPKGAEAQEYAPAESLHCVVRKVWPMGATGGGGGGGPSGRRKDWKWMGGGVDVLCVRNIFSVNGQTMGQTGGMGNIAIPPTGRKHLSFWVGTSHDNPGNASLPIAEQAKKQGLCFIPPCPAHSEAIVRLDVEAKKQEKERPNTCMDVLFLVF